MRCLECDSQYVEKVGTIAITSDYVGDYRVENVKYFECPVCGKRLFPKETAIKISEKEKGIQRELIKKLPVGDFIPATEAAKVLGKSRQALHKNRRIRKGFVYFIERGGKRLYHKKSVEMFKQSGDGRFNLMDATKPRTIESVVTYYKETSKYLNTGIYADTPSYNWQRREIKGNPPTKYIQ